MSPCAKFCANIRNNKRAMAINRIQDGGHRHFEFITIATFGHMAYFL